MTILVTGVAGFIGMHVASLLLERGDKVIGLDNLNSYYDPKLKQDRLDQLKNNPNFSFSKIDINESNQLDDIFKKNDFTSVIHLAAQAGVRYSLENPRAYIDSNIVGFLNILESCKNHHIKHLVYASSSSVYGGNTKMPFSEKDRVDNPVSLYAATKRSNELMAHTYSHLYNLPSTGLRFFTVYGPWGRPDMALFLFTKAIIERKPINLFNNGEMLRDFTYISDIVEGIIRVLDKVPQCNKDILDSSINSTKNAPYKIFNIGNSKPVSLMKYVEAIEDALQLKAIKNFLPMQMGDVVATSSDVSELNSWVDFKPDTEVRDGVAKFVDWYKNYY